MAEFDDNNDEATLKPRKKRFLNINYNDLQDFVLGKYVIVSDVSEENDGSYRGCLRIHLNLSRPINIVSGTRPPSIYDILQEDRTMEKTLTSFYMPRDAVKAIHINSQTTTREVIVALLRKFKVVDNPQKFALYEKTCDQVERAKLRRLSETECPLMLAIDWGAKNIDDKKLVLQENDTADIQWDFFSLPELSNFLRILDREEEEYQNQIRDKYGLIKRKIEHRLNRT